MGLFNRKRGPEFRPLAPTPVVTIEAACPCQAKLSFTGPNDLAAQYNRAFQEEHANCPDLLRQAQRPEAPEAVGELRVELSRIVGEHLSADDALGEHYGQGWRDAIARVDAWVGEHWPA